MGGVYERVYGGVYGGVYERGSDYIIMKKVR